MIPNIKPITEDSNAEDIQGNFEAIQAAIVNKQLAFHYLNLYNLKGSVVAERNAITRDYNLLNLNEALLIVVNPDNDDTTPAEEQWRGNMTLYAGDYLVKTAAGPLRVPGPTTGYYVPSFSNTDLTFRYTTDEPDPNPDPPITKNIQGATGGGYDLTYTTLAVNTAQDFSAQYSGSDLIIPIIQIYDSNTLIDYPYTLILSGLTYTLTLNGA